MLQRIMHCIALWVLVTGCAVRGQQAAAPAPRDSAPERLAQALAPYEELGWQPKNTVERTVIPYARLQLKKARLAAKPRAYYPGATDATARNAARQGLAALERLGSGKPLLARAGALTECAYITSNDGTVQPYYVYLPEDYDPSKRWPMLVFLHGYVPSISVLDPWILSEESYTTAGKHGFVLLTPYGRRNTDFQGVGELDVYEATREVMDLYSIDPERVHLTGVSMGGAGTYYIGLRRPGRYAAYTAMDAQSDMHTWWPRILRNWPKDRADIPPFRRWLVEWDNPVDLVMNARNQHYFILHGENDPLVSVEQSRTFVRLAKEIGIPMDYYEVPNAGHYIYWEPQIFDRAWSWHTSFTRPKSPKRITYKTFSLEYERAFWCRIGDFLQWGIPATLDARMNADGSALTITTENIRRLVLDQATSPTDDLAQLTVTVNGRETACSLDGSGNLVVPCAEAEVLPRDWPPRKRHGLCGPVEEAFDTPFVVVRGTTGSEEAAVRVNSNVDKWVNEWDQFADGRPTVLLDEQVTDAMIAERSLILFGTPSSNSVLARLHEKLPIRIADQRYEVAGRTYEGDDLGLVMCYPNPLNPERYVVIYSGELYGERCGINHKHDLIPDFIVFNNRTFNYDDTNQHEVAGFFDMNWELSPRLTWIRSDTNAVGR